MSGKQNKKVRKMYKKEVQNLAETKVNGFMKDVNIKHQQERERWEKRVKTYKIMTYVMAGTLAVSLFVSSVLVLIVLNNV